jgi:hypothetical protein
MRLTWIIHCHPDRCYWECVTESEGEPSHVVRFRSEDFSDRTKATLDAQRNGLDPDNPDHVIVRKNYSA